MKNSTQRLEHNNRGPLKNGSNEICKKVGTFSILFNATLYIHAKADLRQEQQQWNNTRPIHKRDEKYNVLCERASD